MLVKYGMACPCVLSWYRYWASLGNYGKKTIMVLAVGGSQVLNASGVHEWFIRCDTRTSSSSTWRFVSYANSSTAG